MDARRTKDFVEHFRATKAGNSTERRSSSGGDDGNTGNILSSASSLAAAAGAPSQHAAGAVAAQSSASTRRDSGSSGGIWGETENDLAAGGAAARLFYCCCSFGMLITSIYCAHNMGAHCASLLPKPRLRPRPCRLHLSTTPAPPATCDACIAGHAAGSAASRFPTAFFPGAFLSFTRPFFLSVFFFFAIPIAIAPLLLPLLLHSKFNYRECEFLPDSESDSASHVLFQHRRISLSLSANFQRISILFAVDLCNACPPVRPFVPCPVPRPRRA